MFSVLLRRTSLCHRTLCLTRCRCCSPLSEQWNSFTSAAKPWTFDKDASYLIVGGSGGLGRAIIRWMADHSATNIIIISRHSATSKEATATVAQLEARGINIHAFACDQPLNQSSPVCSPRVVGPYPHQRVYQRSHGLARCRIPRQHDLSQCDLTLRSKAQTSMNLHCLLGPDLDFFILLSSLIDATGQMASANYAAECAGQDELSRYRAAKDQGPPH
ncbi:KR domain-containing protein [Aspergillus spinulosporus]